MAYRKDIQCKDIPDRPILEFLEEHRGEWSGWHDLWPRSEFGPTVRDAMPTGVPDKVVLAKMKMLMRRGLVDGCDCGCRGDFEITGAGRAWLSRSSELAGVW